MAQAEEWFKDEDFWKYYAPVIFDNKRWSEVPEVVCSISALAALMLYGAGPGSVSTASKVNDFPAPEGRGAPSACAPAAGAPRVLDLCCGLGRISAELARSGYAVTGVDLSASLLETAREDAAYEGLEIEYVHADARSFKRPLFFDLAVNLYISFGYFEDPAEDRLLLRNVYESLKPGGSFIIETLGKEIAVRDFTPGEWFERAGYTVLTEYEVSDSWAGLKNRWILIKKDPASPLPARIEKTFTQRLYSASELRALLIDAGFSAVELYGGWDERPYDEFAETLIAVGRKGG